MSQFVFFATLLGLIAVAFAVSALWQRSRALALVLALALPLAAVGIYAFKGQPAAFDAKNVAAPTTMEEAVAQLQMRLDADPNNFTDRAMLARAYMGMEKFELARDNYAAALKLNPDDSDLSVEYAESLLRTSADHSFPPAAVRLLENAVAKNPKNQRALYFLGLHQFHSKQPAEAAATWEKLLPLLDPETAGAVAHQIDAARSAAGMPPLPAGSVPATSALNVEVLIDPTLANLAKPGDVLFVFARSTDGQGPPLAVKRVTFDKFPLRVQLTDADSPMPAATLSTQKSVVLMARLSKSGDAKAASGDIEADPVQVDIASGEQVSLTLSRSVP
jgi:cytochrome c-type biogenesis protein CcmH